MPTNTHMHKETCTWHITRMCRQDTCTHKIITKAIRILKKKQKLNRWIYWEESFILDSLILAGGWCLKPQRDSFQYGCSCNDLILWFYILIRNSAVMSAQLGPGYFSGLLYWCTGCSWDGAMVLTVLGVLWKRLATCPSRPLCLMALLNLPPSFILSLLTRLCFKLTASNHGCKFQAENIT